MKRKAIVISVGAVIAAMAFVGVAFSLETNARFVAPTPEAIAESARKAAGTEEKTHPSPRVDGQTWGLRSYTNVRGELCLSQDVPGELVGTGCISAEKIFARGPLYSLHGARQDPNYSRTAWSNQWVYGIAHPAVTKLTLVNMDCSTEDLALDADGAFNYVAGREKIASGASPFKLVARGPGGAILAEKDVAVNLSRNARDAGLLAPRPGQACS